MQEEILFDVKDGIGYVRLNRPDVLNSLTLDMIEAFHAKLNEWQDDPSVASLWISGEGRAFCAGGDVRSVYKAVKNGDRGFVDRFYRREYQMNYRLATYPKPITAYMDGIVMGGGAGIAMHCRTRIVTDNSIFAMPECAIGFFPDVGASFFLNQAPGAIGLYLALTGVRVRSQGLIYSGLATHYVPDNRTGHLTPEKLDALSIMPEPGPLKGLQDRIDATFSLDGVAEIEAILSARGDTWATDTLGMMQAHSPLSKLVTFELLRRSKGRDLRNCLTREYTLSQHFALASDFSEGVRAKLIDKDNLPHWQPERIDAIGPDKIDMCFVQPEDAQQWNP